MDKILKDRLKPKERKHGKYPWDFKSPTYDNRTSCSMDGGDTYGVGKTQPVGSHNASGLESGPIPMQSKAWNPDSIFKHEDMKG